METDDLTKIQQADVLAFERLMKRFKAHGLMMHNWSGKMVVFRVKDWYATLDDGENDGRLSNVVINLDNHGMLSDGGDPD